MNDSSQKKKVGFIGLGIMGKGMVRNLMAGGHALYVYSRSREKCLDVLDEGAHWCETVADIARGCDVVITMVGYPSDVEGVYFGPEGLIENARRGSILIDMTTSSPGLARRIADAADKAGLAALDAPVSGGDVGARQGTLAIMCGGDAQAFEAVRPLFACMGKTIALLGPCGSGQHTKMVNQIVIAGTVIGVAEALGYAERAGLDLEAVLNVIGQGAAGGFQLNVVGKRMAQGDFAPGFFVHHFLKDMGIAMGEAEAMGLDLKGLKTAFQQFSHYAEEGGRLRGTQGIFELYAGNAQES